MKNSKNYRKITPKMICSFFDKVKKTKHCWLWTGGIANFGYGKIGLNSGLQFYAHRFSWMIHNDSPIPEGLCVLHKCDVPRCVNPQHLFLGTHKDNMTDQKEKGRSLKGSKHGKAKLTEKDVLKIRKILKTGTISQSKIAEAFNVTPKNISRINCRIAWKHI